MSPGAVEIVFEHGLPFECTCPKCDQALRFPVKTTCNHYYCKSCAERLSVCQVCQTPIAEESLIVDKEKQRQIHALPVKCTFFDNGCQWKGVLKELQAHIENCDHKELKCPNCGQIIPGKDLAQHLSHCQTSVVKCEYCGILVKSAGFQRHLEKCGKVIVSCPFLCGLINVERDVVETHKPNCPNVDNVCPFVQFGCKFLGDKSTVQQHLSEEPVRHLVYLCDEATLIKKTHDRAFNDFEAALSRRVDLISRADNCERIYGPQFIWRIDDVTTKMNESKSGTRPTIVSVPFMSGRHGYKMILLVSLFGDGRSRGEYMSAYVALMSGEYDSVLSWPFQQIVKISLLDPNPVVSERIDITYVVDTRSLMGTADVAHFLDRPIGDRNAAFGAQSFCRQNKLPQYIENDTLFLRVDVHPSTPFFESNGITAENVDEIEVLNESKDQMDM